MVEGTWIREGLGEGMERFGRYFGRKGWFGFKRVDVESGETQQNSAGDGKVEENGAWGGETEEGMIEETEKKWHVGEQGGRILVEVATAYAITKVLLPVRVLVSVWATPWFARVFWGLYQKGLGGGAATRGFMGKTGQGVKKRP